MLRKVQNGLLPNNARGEGSAVLGGEKGGLATPPKQLTSITTVSQQGEQHPFEAYYMHASADPSWLLRSSNSTYICTQDNKVPRNVLRQKGEQRSSFVVSILVWVFSRPFSVHSCAGLAEALARTYFNPTRPVPLPPQKTLLAAHLPPATRCSMRRRTYGLEMRQRLATTHPSPPLLLERPPHDVDVTMPSYPSGERCCRTFIHTSDASRGRRTTTDSQHRGGPPRAVGRNQHG